MRILLVEDDDTIAIPLIDGLGRYGFAVDRARTGRDALAWSGVDLILLDLGLPDADGIDICQRIRAQSAAVPIIMLTARGTEVDRIVGLEVGADDYLAKPVSLRELVARIRAVTRRTRLPATPEPWTPTPTFPPPAQGATAQGATAQGHPAYAVPAQGFPTQGHPAHTVPAHAGRTHAGPAHAGPARTVPDDLIRVDDLTIDRRTRQVYLRGREIVLALKEFDLLVALAGDPGAVRTRDRLMETVWDEHYYGSTKTLDFHVAALRRKLGDPGWVQTVRGVGFRLVVPDDGGTPAGVAGAGRGGYAG